jgi:hypothetical protein
VKTLECVTVNCSSMQRRECGAECLSNVGPGPDFFLTLGSCPVERFPCRATCVSYCLFPPIPPSLPPSFHSPSPSTHSPFNHDLTTPLTQSPCALQTTPTQSQTVSHQTPATQSCFSKPHTLNFHVLSKSHPLNLPNPIPQATRDCSGGCNNVEDLLTSKCITIHKIKASTPHLPPPHPPCTVNSSLLSGCNYHTAEPSIHPLIFAGLNGSYNNTSNVPCTKACKERLYSTNSHCLALTPLLTP